MTTIVAKIQERLRYDVAKAARGTWLHPYLHGSYWHYLIVGANYTDKSMLYFAARPNRGAGIGHQLANWIAGYWWAQQFELTFAHIAFSNSTWENFLGFGLNDVKVDELVQQGYKKIRLPYFDQNKSKEIELVRLIIASYGKQRVVFIAEQDQDFTHQELLRDSLKQKFYAAPARKHDKIVYDKKYFNIAIHIRRTVVIEGVVTNETDKIKSKRWLAADYYETVLKQLLDTMHFEKPVRIYIFSTGKAEEFAEFSQYGEVHFCNDMDEYQSFAHLVFADLLITSKSSFSYKPALMNNGIKVCPRNFWHGYPDSDDWILCENDGSFDVSKLNRL